MFSHRANQLNQLAYALGMTVLVWGPGDPGPTAAPDKQQAYAKRLQIKAEIKQKFPNAEVYFSEDPEMVALAAGVPGQLQKEALQAKVADLVIMLDISRGTDLELDHFVPTYSWFRDKVHVFLPAQYVPPQGLVREVFDYLLTEQVTGYTASEFSVCTVATVRAIEVAHAAALHILLKQ